MTITTKAAAVAAVWLFCFLFFWALARAGSCNIDD